MTTLLRETRSQRDKVILEHYAQRVDYDLAIQYDVTKLVEGLTTINDAELLSWQEQWEKRPVKVKEEALDVLYEIVFPKK